MEIPKMVRQNEVVHRSELRRWGRVWDFEGKECDSQKMEE